MLVLPLLSGASAAATATMGDPVPRTAAPPPTDDHIAFLEGIWEAAWGLDFVPGQSGMTIYEAGAGEWTVLVSDSGAEENPFVAEGSFIESGPAQYISSWEQDLLDEAGVLSVDHYLVSGILYGSTGRESDIDAMLTEMLAPGENPRDAPVLVRVLTPVEVGPSSSSGGVAATQPQLTAAQCAAIWDLQIAACGAKYDSDRNSCGLITIGCFTGCAVICSASTFGYAICLAICWAGCTAYEAGCLNDAVGDYNACIAAADAARMACDPGWTPPPPP